ncbi:MAG: FliM/FliN family flagellar motor switch protein [Phycisphaerae bacterium]
MAEADSSMTPTAHVPADTGANSDAGAKSAATVPAVDVSTRCVLPHQTAALAFLREDFVRQFAGELSAVLRGAFSKKHIRLAGAMLLPADEFLSSVEEATCCFPLAIAGAANAVASDDSRFPMAATDRVQRATVPDGGAAGPWAAMIEITPSIAFPIINCLLGGSSDDPFIPRRPLTAIERRLLARIVERACASLVRAWPGRGAPRLTPIADSGTVPPSGTVPGCSKAGGQSQTAGQSPAVQSAVRNPQSEVLLTAGFELGLDRQAGTMRIALAVDLLPPLASPLRAATAAGPGASPLEVTAALDETTIAAADLARLAPGDILALDTPIDGEVIIRVAGIPKFVGRLGTCNGRRAVTITRRIN